MTSNKQNEHPLHFSWVLWEHQRVQRPEDYLNSMRDICEFSTVEEFWRVWAFMPRPSEVLYDGQARKEQFSRKVDGFSLFKRGIRPEWEDPQNQKASELSTSGPFDYNVDILWENMALALIGELIEESDEICGCRVVDKFKKSGKSGSTKPHYRLELWLKPHVSKEVAAELKVRLLEALADGDQEALSQLPNFELKSR